MAELIKIDRNGSKHWKGLVQCDRCGGRGYYTVGIRNGQPVLSPIDSGICWKCHGAGKIVDTWIERTPEYQAKLDAKRAAKMAAKQAEIDTKIAERLARERAEEERREQERLAKEAEKKISKFVGTVGEKITAEVEYIGSPYFERKSFGGYGTETCYIHTFKDYNGNKIVWKTSSGLDLEEGQRVKITGKVKEQSEYKGEKQTQIIRLKVLA